jgi:hypothetical protein
MAARMAYGGTTTAQPYTSGYRATAQKSAVTPHASGYMNPALAAQSWQNLAAQAEQERQMNYARAAERQNAVIGGYDQQIARNRQLGVSGYKALEADYDALTADALATRARNMDRIDQYGNSMRQDLDIQNQQRLAAAQQSAIQRGLGNTTITDSLVRGQNFDNTRQMLSLEDQLLQNRIATDSQLSGAYQSSLQNRAQALSQQRNTDIDRDTSLVNQQLGYIGGIQDDQQGFQNVANLYTSLWEMQNANQQAEANRRAQNPLYGRPKTNIVLGRPQRGAKW